MASNMLGALIRQSLAIHSNNRLLISISRSLFTNKRLRPNNYLKARQEKEPEFIGSKNELFDRLTKPNESAKEDVEKMLYIVKTQQDVDVIVKAIKNCSFPKTNKTEYGKLLMDYLLLTNRFDIAFDIFTDKEMSLFLVNPTNLLSVMFMLVEANRFADAVTAFELYAAQNESLDELKGQHFAYLTKSLLSINTKEAFDKMKVFLGRMGKSNKLKSELAGNTLCCIHVVFLSINQNEPEFAYEFLNSSLDFKKSVLMKNLNMIVCAKLNRLDKAVEIMETVLNNKGSWNFGYKNFFEYTIKCLQEAAEKPSTSANTKTKLDELIKRARSENQIDDVNLLEAIAKSNTINIPQQKQQQEKQQPQKETSSNQQKQQQPAKIKSNNEAQKAQKTVKNENKDKEPSNRNKKENKTSTSKVDLELLTRMSTLYGEKNYAELIGLFEKDVLNINKPSQLKSVPDSYLSLVTCSLLFMNSKESLEKMKNLLEVFASNNIKFSDDSKLHLFLLAIKQDDPFYALGFISSSDIEKTNKSLYKNLKSIVLAKLKNLSGAVAELEEIFQIGFNRFAYEGAIFPYTLNVVRESISKLKNDTSSKLDERFEKIQKQLIVDNRLSNIDLPELCTRNLSSVVELSNSLNQQHSSRKESGKQTKENTTPNSTINQTGSKPPIMSDELPKLTEEKLKRAFYNRSYKKFINDYLKSIENGDVKLSSDANMLKMFAKSIRGSKIKINDLKVLLDRLKKVGDLTKLGANFYVDVFLAIIDQENPLYALEFIADFDPNESFRKQQPSIYNNILAIGFSLIDRLDVAFKQVEAVLDIKEDLNQEDSNNFQGKLFPMTLKCLKDSGLRLNKPEYAERYKLIHQRTIEKGAISVLDLNSLPDI